MSEAPRKPARFDLRAIRQSKPEVEPAPPEPLPEPEEKLVQFGSHMLAGTKRRLKQAAAREGRKQYETLHDAVTEYLARHHPELSED